jgi:hypothetical protein
MFRKLLAPLLVTAATLSFAVPGGRPKSPEVEHPLNSGQQENGFEQRLQNSPPMQRLRAARALPDLTPEQQARLNELETHAKQQMMQLRDELKSQLRAGGGKPAAKPDENQRKQMMQEIRPKIEQISRDLMTGINSVLTESQWAQVGQSGAWPQGKVAGKFHRPTEDVSSPQRPAIVTNPTPLPTRIPIPAITPAASATLSSTTPVNPFVP